MSRWGARLAAACAAVVVVLCVLMVVPERQAPHRAQALAGAGVHSSSPAPGRTSAGPVFTACRREPADPSRTNLRPSALTSADRARAGARAPYIPDGSLVVEAATELDIRDGFLGAGSGYAAAVGQPDGVTQVAERTVHAAPVSVAVLDSPSAGRRVAFVEIRLDPSPPVRWVSEPNLVISTDGGDGGFVAIGPAPAATGGDASDTVADDYLAAFFPDPQKYSTWNQCLVRSTAGHVDGVLFDTGYGDGGYPTYLGSDANGRVVSVVSFGMVLPWNLSGLPGTPPPADEVGP